MLVGIGERIVTGIEDRPGVLEHGRCRAELIRPAEKSLHLGNEHVHIKGLGDKIVAAHVHRHDNVHIIARRGDEYDRHGAYFSYLRAPVIPAHIRKRHVHQHEMRLHARELRHDRAEIGSAGALQRPELHLRADGVGEAAVILYEQNAVFHISPSLFFSAPLYQCRPARVNRPGRYTKTAARGSAAVFGITPQGSAREIRASSDPAGFQKYPSGVPLRR